MKSRENHILIGLSLIALLLFSLMTYIKGASYDFDEVFSLAMLDHSFSKIWIITARDYHPPLSYFILKIFSWIIEPLSGGNLLVYRITGIIGYFTIILLCIFPIRRLWGFKMGVICILLFTLMPISFYIYSNFRMYAWATPAVLAVFIYSYEAYKTNDKWAWAKLIVFALSAMYIHYYALISTFVTCVLLFAAILLSNREEKKSLLKNYVCFGIILVLCYAPWIYFFVGQLSEVKSDYWIELPALSDILFAIQYYFVPKYYTEKYANLLSNTWLIAIIPVLLLLTLSIIILSCSKWVKKAKENLVTSLIAFGVILFSLSIVMLYTYFVSPVYHIRYLMSYFGLFVLGLSFCIHRLLANKSLLGKILVIIFSLFLVVDFGVCFYFNIQRSSFSFSDFGLRKIVKEREKSNNYYASEECFSDLGYFSILYPQHNYFLVTEDDPTTRKVVAPYLVGDTISGEPFTNFKKIKVLDERYPFYYMTKENPQQDSTFTAHYRVVDSLFSGLYKVEPIR